MGNFLGNNMDRAIFAEALKGAEATTNYVGETTQTLNEAGATYANKRVLAISGATAASETIAEKGARLKSWLFKIAAYMDNNAIPEGSRYIIMTPDAYYALAQLPEAISTDYRGQGSIAQGTILELAGFRIFKSANLGKNPKNGGIITSAGDAHIYNGVLNVVEGVAFIPASVGTVKLRDIKTGMQHFENLQGDLFTAKYMVGHKYLRPDTIVSFGVDTDL
jgi:hypothetical protein